MMHAHLRAARRLLARKSTVVQAVPSAVEHELPKHKAVWQALRLVTRLIFPTCGKQHYTSNYTFRFVQLGNYTRWTHVIWSTDWISGVTRIALKVWRSRMNLPTVSATTLYSSVTTNSNMTCQASAHACYHLQLKLYSWPTINLWSGSLLFFTDYGLIYSRKPNSCPPVTNVHQKHWELHCYCIAAWQQTQIWLLFFYVRCFNSQNSHLSEVCAVWY